MTVTALFAKYTEATEAWRTQLFKNQQNEIVLEQVCGAPLLCTDSLPRVRT